MPKEIDEKILNKLKEEIKQELKQEADENIKHELNITEVPHQPKKENPIANFFDKYIEPYMWNVKFFAFIAVAVSLLVSLGLLGYGVYEAKHLAVALFNADDAKDIQLLTLSVVDTFLFAMVMMIFSFGAYNLFISKIDNVARDTRSNEIRPKWVQVENFGELKTIFIKVVEMILIITFLELVVRNIELFKENIFSLLIIPVGIALIAFSLKHLHSDEKDNKGE